MLTSTHEFTFICMCAAAHARKFLVQNQLSRAQPLYQLEGIPFGQQHNHRKSKRLILYSFLVDTSLTTSELGQGMQQGFMSSARAQPQAL